MKHTFLWRSQRDTAADGGSGGGQAAPYIPITDLMDPDKQGSGNSGDAGSGDAGTGDAGSGGGAGDGAVTIADDDPLKTEALGEDGKLKEGYEVGADGKLTKTDAAGTGDDEPGDDATATDYFEEVEKLTNRKLEITDEIKETLPDGVDLETAEGRAWLTTPEGTAWRENRVFDMGADNFEQTLAQQDPRGYAYLLHRSAGGTDESFFTGASAFKLPTREELKGSADAQKQVYEFDLRSKGVPDDEIAVLVEAAIKANKLLEKSDGSFDAITKAQQDQLAALQQQQEAEDLQMRQASSAFTSNVQQLIKDQLGFVVPEAEQAAFAQKVLENVRYENGQFYLIQGLSQKNLKGVLEGLFIQHKGADLNKIVARKVATKAAQNLRLQVNKADKSKSTQSNTGGIPSGNVPLSQLWGPK